MKRLVSKKRLDLVLVERGLVDSRQQAQGLIMAGQVMVDGRVVDKPGTRVSGEADITLKATLPYVSRGGLKLEAALDEVHLRHLRLRRQTRLQAPRRGGRVRRQRAGRLKRPIKRALRAFGRGPAPELPAA